MSVIPTPPPAPEGEAAATPPRTDPGRPIVVLFPKGLGIAVVVLLSMQLALGYVQGSLLHRQQDQLAAIRTDLQDLAEAVALGQGAMDADLGDGEAWRPAAPRGDRPPVRRYALARLAVLGGDEEDRARKEVQQSRDTARKGVEEARKAQQQLSVEEAIRKAETRQKTDAAQSQWMKWSMVAVGVVALGLLARAWMRRRG